jgi:hypothetical protein
MCWRLWIRVWFTIYPITLHFLPCSCVSTLYFPLCCSVDREDRDHNPYHTPKDNYLEGTRVGCMLRLDLTRNQMQHMKSLAALGLSTAPSWRLAPLPPSWMFDHLPLGSCHIWRHGCPSPMPDLATSINQAVRRWDVCEPHTTAPPCLPCEIMDNYIIYLRKPLGWEASSRPSPMATQGFYVLFSIINKGAERW